MIGRHAVPLASLMWSFGVIGLVLQASPKIVDQHVAKSSLPPGDESLPITLAVSYLMQTDRFYSASVGIVGATPPQVLAWQIVFRDQNAPKLFAMLAGDANTTAVRLYGLAGLYLVDKGQYRALAAQLSRRGGVVSAVEGCMVFDRPVVDILAEMDRGNWSRDFLVGRELPRR